MKTVLYLIPALAVAVLFLIRAEFLERRRQIYVIKPIATLMVIAAALVSLLEPTRNLMYTIGVLLGLLFSLGGDIALMFQENRKAFTVGLGLFLVAHIVYAVVFMFLGRFSAWDIFSTVVLLVVGVGFYGLIRLNLRSMKGPVIGYILIISVMVSRALSALASPVFNNGQALMIAVGALLFYFSDVILAADRFWRHWRYHHVSLAFYYGGQLLIASAASYFV
ncbi:MAG: hypothetical protein DRJ03_27245 [Chloroflexi bacterium]|nr:MAG: hypothetical protein B6I35_09075 [Anaerolineaceae bacterium 4572_32.2]RLC77229.1 MAG: hypothetical protein DRJ03_27245 [Chloroflexota bacterium]RLC78783.1 MAG: hypothetical protein DRI81_06145 [Chloroflexota bacterium]